MTRTKHRPQHPPPFPRIRRHHVSYRIPLININNNKTKLPPMSTLPLFFLLILLLSSRATASKPSPSPTDGRDVCLSKFKIEELVGEIHRKMMTSHARFSNFPRHQRNCIMRHLNSIHEAMKNDECHLFSLVDHRVLIALGDCIEEIHIVRDQLKRAKQKHQQQYSSRQQNQHQHVTNSNTIHNNLSLASNPVHALSPSSHSQSQPESTSRSSTQKRPSISRTHPEQPQIKNNDVIANRWRNPLPPNSFSIPRKLPQPPVRVNKHNNPTQNSLLRRVAKWLGLSTKDRQTYFYSDGGGNDCNNGWHWCCITIGDDQGFPCFETFCPNVSPTCS